METKYFSPSINIVRDKEQVLDYIPTRNGEAAFNKIISAYQHGTRAFNIVGAYGTGKSAFILAFERVLNDKANYFINPLNGEVSNFESRFIVGEYASFKETFCKQFKLREEKNIFNQFEKRYKSSLTSDNGLLIVADEFGKFLEYAAKESPEEEMYFIQQLAEFVNNRDRNIFLITTLHQSFEDYALSLSKTQRNEWGKVKGRLIEVTFTEPVEQLLYLAAERIQEKNIPCRINKNHNQQLFETISEANAFPMKDYFSFEFAKKLFPFDILSASVVTLAFQAYGQNERSLFTFLESEDYLGLNDFKRGTHFYGLAHIYDYLIYNFHSLLNSKFNPHGTQWAALKDALERSEDEFEESTNEALKLVKTIGLLSIFGRAGQKISNEFISSYGKIALGIEYPEKLIDKLEHHQIIRYQAFSQRYILFKGTDFNINRELELAEDRISKDFAIGPLLYHHFSFPILQAKKVFYEKGTPRYFLFELTEKPINKIPEEANDGYINLIFNELLDGQKLKSYSRDVDNPILYGWLANSAQVREKIIEIEKVQSVKELCTDDVIATAELNQHLINAHDELKKVFVNTFYGEDASVMWYFKGEKLIFRHSKDLNKQLSKICDLIYPKTPTFRNEMMNRERLSGTISSAKKKLIGLVIENSEKPNLGIDQSKFPPERSIYLSLLKETGIHQTDGEKWFIDQPSNLSFKPLWLASEEFLEECTVAPRKLKEFIDLLKQKPFKLKQGFIEFWIPIFLVAKYKEFAFYEDKTFIPTLTDDTLDVAMRQPQKYFISTFSLDKTRLNIFNRYRYFLDQIEENSPSSESFIETIKPFLIFYKKLVPYTRNTKKLGKEALRLRDAIANATNPEKVFFDDIPRALGFTTNDLSDDQKLEEFAITLRATTQELSGAYENLVNRIEEVLNNSLGDNKLTFPNNKILFQKRFRKIFKEALNPKQKVLIQRINTPLDDRKSWISSIATAVIGSSLDNFTDEEEMVFKIRFTQLIHQLDNLTDISKREIDQEKEEVLKLEITSFVKGVQRNLVRFPKSKSKDIAILAEQIKPLLSSEDRQANIALLIKLLQEQIENE